MTDRADFILSKTPIGFVAECADDRRSWVFVGWSSNTAGCEMVFIRTLQPFDRIKTPYLYRASLAHTLMRKFPALEEFRKATE